MATLTPAQKKELSDAFASGKSTVPAPQVDFPKPTVTEAPGGILDPIRADPTGIHVVVAYDSMSLLDTIGLSFNGIDTFDPKEGSLFNKVTFIVSANIVAASVGKTVDVIYAVIRPNGPSLSTVLELEVQPLAQTALPTPRIKQATEDNTVLDLNGFTGNADVVVPKWPLSTAGQTVWLTVSGPGGVPTVKVLERYPIVETEAVNGITRTIARTDLEKFKHGDALTVVCKVGFDATTAEASATPLPSVSYTVEKYDDSVLPEITSVKDSTGVEVPDQGTTFDKSITVSGLASANQKVDILDGKTVVKADLAVGTDGKWTYTLTSLTRELHIITVKAKYGSNPVSVARKFTVAEIVVFKEDFEDEKSPIGFTILYQQYDTKFLNIKVFSLSGHGAVSGIGKVVEGSYIGIDSTALAIGTQGLELKFKGKLANKVVFWGAPESRYPVPTTIELYNEQGVRLSSQKIIQGTNSLTAPDKALFASIKVFRDLNTNSSWWTLMDDIELHTVNA